MLRRPARARRRHHPRFIDTAKGTKTEAAHHGAMAKPEVIGLLKTTFQSAQEMMTR